MDRGACQDALKNGENVSQDSISRVNDLNRTWANVEANPRIKHLQTLSLAADEKAALGPFTPDSNRENEGPVSDDRLELYTPKDGVFDPFAAQGPENFLVAPNSGKFTQESGANFVQRRLNFETTDHRNDMETFMSDDEEILFEIVYGTLLEAIISMQGIPGSPTKGTSQISVSDGFQTPTSAPRLSGTAETCPPAPAKPTRKFRDIDESLCRKLEF